MSLKEILTTWNEAIIHFESGRYEEAIDRFRQITDPSAKILFNIGVAYLTGAIPRHDQALKWFSDAITKDPFLAVAYFQRGCTYLKLKRYREAEADFRSTLDKMRGSNLIDYRQLGLPIKLYTSQVLMNLAVALQSQSDTQGVCECVQNASRLVKDPQHERAVIAALSSLPTPNLSLLELTVKESVFRPSKSLVANLQKKDFLGKAKVVSSISPHDKFVGFEGARKCHSTPASPNPSRKGDHLSVDKIKAMKGSLTPPPPTRPAPNPSRNSDPLSVNSVKAMKGSLTPPPPTRPAPNPSSKSDHLSVDNIKAMKESTPPPPTRPPPALPPDAIKDFNSKYLKTSSGINGHVRSSSGERSRPIPPSRTPPVLKNETASVKRDKPPRPPPPVLKRRV
ncbi:neutrophil cytosol factor 2-like isoform X2 [Haliotis rubra]|uniref:neutrophil cytosol factor 2-like isoform X2 n=1 Tax=Haliotis rubra TaxID=36100 RepID=UPI001EE513B1|nr:neutrophil cytosol factor 2-like isoform X2 [Haliotis rubra]